MNPPWPFMTRHMKGELNPGDQNKSNVCQRGTREAWILSTVSWVRKPMLHHITDTTWIAVVIPTTRMVAVTIAIKTFKKPVKTATHEDTKNSSLTTATPAALATTVSWRQHHQQPYTARRKTSVTATCWNSLAKRPRASDARVKLPSNVPWSADERQGQWRKWWFEYWYY